MKYGYARVSTIHQCKNGNSLEDQRNQLQQEGCDFIVEEQFSSAQMDSPEFQKSFKVFVNEKIFEWVFNIINKNK